VLNIVDALICQYQGEQTNVAALPTVLKSDSLQQRPVALGFPFNSGNWTATESAGMSSSYTNGMNFSKTRHCSNWGTSDPQEYCVEMVR